MSEDILFKLTHVTKVFGIGDKQVKAIDDVSLEIRKGQIQRQRNRRRFLQSRV